MDKYGNAVSLTQTISSLWGSRIVVPGYGFILNNEFQNFAPYREAEEWPWPEHPNLPGPHKRPRTVIAPTIVLDRGKPFLVVGTPGGLRIPGVVVQIIVKVVDFGMDLEDAITAPRFYSHHAAGDLHIEGGFPAETPAALRDLGHSVRDHVLLTPYFGGANAVMVLADGTMIGVGDIRWLGAAAGPE